MLKTLKQVLPELQPRLADLEKHRLEMLKKTGFGKVVTVAILIPGIIFAVATYKMMPMGAVIGGIFAAIASAVAWVLMVSSIQQKYTLAFKTQLMGTIVRSIDPNLMYDPSRKIPQNVYMHSELFPTTPDRYNGEDLVFGKLGNTELLMCELHTESQHTTTDSDGKTSTDYHTIFRGLFIEADFHKNFHGKTFVRPDFAEKAFGFMGRALQQMTSISYPLVTLEDPEFEKEFAVNSSDQVEARYILSTSMMRRMLDLKRRFNANVHISFVDSRMYLAIEMTKNLFEPHFGRRVDDEAYVGEYYEQITNCLGIIDELGLNTRIWSKGNT